MRLTDSGLLELSPAGIYCPVGGFYIDPWRSVDRAVITHGHSDHARWGMNRYLCTTASVPILKHRIGPGIQVSGLAHGEELNLNGVKLSLHPAGHILGSAQVRVEYNGEVSVVTGDYKTESDATCTPFELIKCHTFITESTFGLPIYRWPSQTEVAAEINQWWRTNQQRGVCSMLTGYALGKAQRALSMLDPEIGPIVTHGAVQPMNRIYREQGIALAETRTVSQLPAGFDYSKALVIAPPSAVDTPWIKRFGSVSTAFLSGWMAIRGTRRRQSLDKGFVVSDHVDWPSLIQTISETGAERVWVTHGYSAVVARYLVENGIDGRILSTEFEGESLSKQTESESQEDGEPE